MKQSRANDALYGSMPPDAWVNQTLAPTMRQMSLLTRRPSVRRQPKYWFNMSGPLLLSPLLRATSTAEWPILYQFPSG